MKRINLFLTISALLLVFAGCSKDDEFTLVGAWEQEKSDFIINFGVPGLADMTFSETDPVTITFKADGTGTAVSSDGTDTFNWNLSGDILTISDSDFSLNLTLTTKTKERIVGEQTINAAQFADMFEMDEEDMEFYEAFPNLSIKIVMTLKKKK